MYDGNSLIASNIGSKTDAHIYKYVIYVISFNVASFTYLPHCD